MERTPFRNTNDPGRVRCHWKKSIATLLRKRLPRGQAAAGVLS